jgi:DNA polymerase-3 subunit gamma/tau
MNQSLTAKYRPTTFADMVGQRLTAVVLNQMVENDSVPQALLFSGPYGTGKTSCARILSGGLNPDERDAILDGTSLAVIEIDAASNGSVDDMRGLRDQLRYSVGVKHRTVIIDEAHMVTREGFNALLKIIEEPPQGTVFILVTTEPSKIPDTILSRLTEFEFRRVSPQELLERIIHVAQAEKIEIAHELAVKLAEDADGSVRDAIKNLDFVTRARISTVEHYIELTGQKDVGPLLFASLLTGDHAKIFAVLDHLLLETGDPRVLGTALSDLIVDLFVLKSDGHVKAAGKALEYRLKLAKAVPSDNLFAAVQLLWELKTKVRWSEDQRAALATALILVADKLNDGRTFGAVTPDAPAPSQVPSEQSAPRALSLSEVQQS